MKNHSPVTVSPIPKGAMAGVIERLQAHSSICAAFLHGSAVNGLLRPESDLDIALFPFPKAELSMKDRISLAGDLESLLERTIDLGVLRTKNLVYVKEVIQHGELLFSKDRFLSERFFSTCLSLYADLQEDRKEVLHAYSAR